MQITCSLSGLKYHSDHFQVSIREGITYHPIFDVPLARLHKFYTLYLNGSLSNEESYLLTLALLKSSNLCQFRTAAKFTPDTPKLVAVSITELYGIVTLIQEISRPSFSLPCISINPDSSDLSNLREWIKIWYDGYKDFREGLAYDRYLDSIKRKENALIKFINSPQIPPQKYAHVLADWAAIVCSFPPYITEYWHELIVKSYNAEEMAKIPLVDMEELQEHCEREIDEYSIGSVYSHHLYAAISDGIDRIKSVQSFKKDKDTGFAILDQDNKEHAILINMIEQSTVSEPLRSEYVTDFEYKKALMAWKLTRILKPSKDQGV